MRRRMLNTTVRLKWIHTLALTIAFTLTWTYASMYGSVNEIAVGVQTRRGEVQNLGKSEKSVAAEV
jgi:hypothetical protein